MINVTQKLSKFKRRVYEAWWALFCLSLIFSKNITFFTFNVQGGNCFCVIRNDHDDQHRRDCPNCTCIQSDGRDHQGNNDIIYAVYEIDTSKIKNVYHDKYSK